MLYRLRLKKYANAVSLRHGLALTLCLAFLPQISVSDEIVARLSYHWPVKHQSAKHAVSFAEEVNKRAAGKLRIDLFPGGQLYGIREQLDAITDGSIEIGGVVSIVSFPPINRNYNIAVFPSMFNGYEQQRAFFETTDAGKGIMDDLMKKADFQILMYNPVGPLITASAKSKMDTVASFEGLKARALFKMERPRWAALGANTVSLSTGEVYQALQTGMIDTLNTVPVGLSDAQSWREYLKYAQLPYQGYVDAYLVVKSSWFEKLPRDLQNILIEVGQEIGDKATSQVMGSAQKNIDSFVEYGGEITTLSGESAAEFDELMAQEVVPKLTEFIDADVMKAAKEFTAQ